MTRLDLIEEFENKTELPATWSNGGTGGYTEEYTKWLEQRLVKNLTIHVVSQRSELLNAFMDWYKSIHIPTIQMPNNEDIDDYLKSI